MKSIIHNSKFIIQTYWPILTLLVLNLVLVIANYKPDTYLIGWDNLMPELNFGVNIQRSVFSVWQEYQSLGLLGGMGHASDLIRQTFLYQLSFILPNNTLRYFWTFLTLFIGGAGAYFLAKYVFSIQYSVSSNLDTRYSILDTKIPAFIAGISYTLSIATIQTYYTVFETFSSHFASLPWILLVSIAFIKNTTFKSFIFLFAVFLLSAPAFYVPTIFVVVVISILILLAVEFFNTPSNSSLSRGVWVRERGKFLKKSALIFATLFVVNSYWLLPFSYFTIQNAHININAKIDQMDTESIYLQNKEFGNLENVAQLKGFWFNNVDPDIDGNNRYMLAPWRAHFSNPLVPTASFGLFVIILLGFINSIIQFAKNRHLSIVSGQLSIAALFLFSFTMLATDTFPFSWIDELFRKLPLFSQAFRFPFTKFGILAALAYSIMLAFGISFILTKTQELRTKTKLIIRYSLFLIPLAAILWIAAPAFTGNLFYNKERLAIPAEYAATFDYFKHADQNARIANLPQPTFWGWTNYSWGNGGSGFLWYGIKQPILDRAFDVWSENSENYYYQVSGALYSKDPKKLEDVLNKYQVSYILLDENVIYPSSPKSLMYQATEKMLAQTPGVALDKSFGKIKIYKVTLKNKPDSFVFTLPGGLAAVQQPYWSESDTAYSTLGNYISETKTQDPITKIQYPFGSLFSQKALKNSEFEIVNMTHQVGVTTKIDLSKNSTLVLPTYNATEKIIPISFYKTTNDLGNILVNAKLTGPQIFLDGKKIAGNTIDYQLFTLPSVASYPITINVNGIANIVIKKEDKDGLIGTSFATLSEDNRIVVASANILESTTIPRNIFSAFSVSTLSELPKGQHTLLVNFPKIDDSYLSVEVPGKNMRVDKCNIFRTGETTTETDGNLRKITTTNSSACLPISSSTQSADQGYVVFTDTENVSGRALHFWVLNEDVRKTPLDIYLDKKNEINSFVVPSAQAEGVGYSYHFENSSIGGDSTTNVINSLKVYPIPYKFITGISIGLANNVANANYAQVENVQHPNESLYVVNLTPKNQEPTTLVLSQSYDPGWKAYEVSSSKYKVLSIIAPFLFGKEIKEHIKVNDWENGWILESSSMVNGQLSIVLVYLPQYLQYAGFGAIILLGIAICIKGITNKFHRNPSV